MSPAWTCLLSLISLVLSGLGDDSGTGGAGWCRRPDITNMIPAKEEFYNVTDSLMVQCEAGYRPSQEAITCIHGQNGDRWDHSPWCVAQCKRPDGAGMILPEKEFYDKNEDLYVKCEAGYRPSSSSSSSSSSYMWTRCTNPRKDNEWAPPPQCIAQCKRPDGAGMILPAKEFYDKDEDLYVKCEAGYRTSSSSSSSSSMLTQCTNPRMDNEWAPPLQCIAQCKRLESTAGYIIHADKASYDVGDHVAVECNAGYRTVSNRIKCVTHDRWDPAPWCVERCKKPEINNLENVAPNKEYYNLRNEISIQCKPGYYPSSPKIRCTNNGDRDVWMPTAICIGVKVTAPEVTSTSVRLQIVCSPDQCHDSGTSYISSCIYLRGVYKGCEKEKDVIFYGLKQNTQYEIRITRVSDRSPYHLETIYITTGESDPPNPKFEKKDFTIHLHPVPDVHGPISHYEIIIFTEPGSNTSDCLQAPHTHYNASPTSYTAALLPAQNVTMSITLGDNRQYGGFLNAPLTPSLEYAAYVRVTSKWKKDTSSCAFVGFFTDFTSPLNSTSSSTINLDLALILWITVPIFSWKLLVLVVLVKIQFTLKADLKRNEQSEGLKILYRKRGDECESVEEAADYRVYEDPEETAHS